MARITGAAASAVVFATSLVLSLVSVPAHAASDRECRAYAVEAVQQHGQNRMLGCGFSGERWHANGGAHFLFCKTVGAALSGNESDIRRGMIANCRQANAGNQGGGNQGGGGNQAGAQCKPNLRVDGHYYVRDVVGSRVEIIKKWEQTARQQHGVAFASFNAATNSSAVCQLDSSGTACVASGRPCSRFN